MFGEVFDTSPSRYTSHFTTHDKMQAVLDFPFQRRRAGLRGELAGATERCATSSTTTTGTRTPTRTPTSCRPSSATTTWAASACSSQPANPGADDAELLAARPARARADVLLARQPGHLLRRRAGLHRRRRRPARPPGHVPEPVAEYNDDDLIGTDATHGGRELRPRPPALPRDRASSPQLTRRHPALRNGAQQHRYADRRRRASTPSRASTARSQREYVVALNNAESAQTAAIPTYVERRGAATASTATGPAPAAHRRRRRAARHRAAAVGRRLPLAGRIPRVAARAVDLARRAGPSRRRRGRIEVARRRRRRLVLRGHLPGRRSATAAGRRSARTTTRRTASSTTSPACGRAPTVRYRAVVLDNAGHTRRERRGAPRPRRRRSQLDPTRRAEGSNVRGTRRGCGRSPTRSGRRTSVTLRAQRRRRRVDDGRHGRLVAGLHGHRRHRGLAWRTATEIRYRAVLTEPGRRGARARSARSTVVRAGRRRRSSTTTGPTATTPTGGCICSATRWPTRCWPRSRGTTRGRATATDAYGARYRDRRSRTTPSR